MNGNVIQTAVAPMMGGLVAIVLATAIPLAFMAQLLWSELALARRRIALSGKPPINGLLFYSCKYLAIGTWCAVALQSFGLGWRPLAIHPAPPAVSLAIWVIGFGLLFLGRIGLCADFRLGLPNEITLFRRAGVFRYTRNPMYAGIDMTMIAAFLYTGNPALLATGIFVVAVQHRIIRAEERWLEETFGDEYLRYRERVGRYVTLPLALRCRVRALLTLVTMGHCAPTVMCSMLAACGLKADWLIRLASALPGGIGNTGGECGGITSPLILLGLVHGLDGAEGGLPRVFDRSCNHIEKFR
ncbi:MAG: C-GCAxxG-C-C family (seleno)protein, partial [Spirochaetaceae bacterium]|nr:C-GCAxxG-C-C family (seleno)protein [Spirochaetaceae bacterium]